MTYDEALAARVRAALTAEPDVQEKRMFGGLAWMVGGSMAVAAMPTGLLVRCPPGRAEQLLTGPGVEPFAMGGRVGAGWVVVPEPDDVVPWVTLGLTAIGRHADGRAPA